jgi:spore germination protein KA
MIEGSPLVFGMPATLMHLLQTPDLISMRFPYGVFKRMIIVIGVFIASLLPALYLSVAQFHNDMLPLAMMTSIYETESKIAIPLVYELLFLSLGFDLILEAGSRVPGVLSSGLSAVSALVIGQAVVAAELVSPLMIVLVAIAGLGTLILPEYSMSITIRVFQLLMLFVAAVGGLFGVLLAIILFSLEVCTTKSLGVPLLWSLTPERMHNPDNLTRYPIWQQRIRAYFVNPAQLFRARGRIRAWEREDKNEQ